MELVMHPTGAIDLTTTPLHLAPGSRALAVEGFGWDDRVLASYVAAVSGDGPDGRLVMVFESHGSWESWERHPAGDEVVICLSGRMTLVQEIDGSARRVELGPCEAIVNPPGVWHTADVHEPGRFLTITPGEGTEHRPR
jgi:quercetin dioxygenase-like cupin family protein